MTRELTIRIATPADIEAIFDVRTSVRENHLDREQLAERGVTYESVAATLDGGATRTWVADGADGVCGFSTADATSGSIFALFVDPRAERRGCGRALLEAAEEWLFSAGWQTIWLNTGEEPSNRAHAFYRSAGWIMVGPADHGDVRYEKRRV